LAALSGSLTAVAATDSDKSRAGENHQIQKGQEAASRDLTEAIKANPQDKAAWEGLGQVYFNKGEFDKASEAFSRAISLAPKNPSLYSSRANSYFLGQKLDKAIADWKQCLALNPVVLSLAPFLVQPRRKRDTSHYRKASLYERLHDYKHAAGEYEKVISTNKNDDEAYTKRGHVLMLMGDYPHALIDLTRAI
jgi:tetratricopeptide (TPR) repeat protein